MTCTMAEFKFLVKETKSNTKSITKSISIHSDYLYIFIMQVDLACPLGTIQ